MRIYSQKKRTRYLKCNSSRIIHNPGLCNPPKHIISIFGIVCAYVMNFLGNEQLFIVQIEERIIEWMKRVYEKEQ
jgi:hypothetical protein